MVELYKELLDKTSDWFFEVDKDANITYTNNIVKNFLGLDSKDVLGKSFFDYVFDEDKEQFTIMYNQKILKKENIDSIEFRVKHNMKIISLIVDANIIKNNENKAIGFRGICKKIIDNSDTQNKKQIQPKKLECDTELFSQLENQKKSLDNILQNIPIPIFYKDKNGLYLGANKSWEEMTGINFSDVVGKSVFDIAPLNIAKVYAAQDEKVFNLEENPQVYDAEVINKKKDIKYKVVFSKSAFFDENNEVAGLVGSIIDRSEITKLENEKKENERALFQQAKLSAMGEMLENISHKWRQPLSVISTASSGLLLQLEFANVEQNEIEKAFKTILDTTISLSKTLDTFRDFFQKDENKSNITIEFAIKKARELLSTKYNDVDIEFIQNIQNIELKTFEHELIHIFLNILSSSARAFDNLNPNKKIIKIDAKKEENKAYITIHDNAGGVSQEGIKKVFEPYFNAKRNNSGAGLGLFMNKKIIQEYMNGEINISNEVFTFRNIEHKGLKIEIILPLD